MRWLIEIGKENKNSLSLIATCGFGYEEKQVQQQSVERVKEWKALWHTAASSFFLSLPKREVIWKNNIDEFMKYETHVILLK